MKTMRIVAAVIVTAALAMAVLGQPTSNGPQRLIVLLKPGSAPLPDIAALGGSIEFKLADRMIVTVPAEAVAAISSNPRVQFVQRSGAPAAVGAESLHVAPASGPGQWSTGAYVYDGAGNISAIGTNGEQNSDGKTNAYAYDKVGRLVQGTANYAAGNRSEIYAYDPFGNMTSRARDGALAVPIQIDSATNRTGLHNELGRYDAGGNEIHDPAISSTRRFDALNMMTYKHTDAVADSPAVDEYYVYTPDDQRIGVLAAATASWTWSLRDEGGAVLRQFGSSETARAADWLWVEDYVYAGGRLLGAERMASQGGRRHFHLDHLGTPRLITGPTGILIARHDYLPFGEEITPTNTERLFGFDRAEPRQFTGHERDDGDNPPATLDYMHARYYGPHLGRLVSVDPKIDFGKALPQPQAWNRYVYVLDNPINGVDPDGRAEIKIAPPSAKTLAGWTPAQRAAENMKNAQHAVAAERGQLVVTKVTSREPLRGQWEKSFGPASKHADVDHVQDLQLGGHDDLGNAQLLDRSVNRSNGARMAQATRGMEPGTVITKVSSTVLSVAEVASLVNMGVTAYLYSSQFEKQYGRSPTFSEFAYYLRTGDERSTEQIQRDMLQKLLGPI